MIIFDKINSRHINILMQQIKNDEYLSENYDINRIRNHLYLQSKNGWKYEYMASITVKYENELCLPDDIYYVTINYRGEKCYSFWKQNKREVVNLLNEWLNIKQE